MKKILLSLFLYGMACSAQDVITLNSGDEISTKVLEVTDTEIRYKKWSNKEGPTYSISKGEVFMIKYINGEKDVFRPQGENISSLQSTKSGLLKIHPAANNMDMIYNHNTPVQFVSSNNSKKAKWFFPIMAMSESSLVSSDDLQMEFVPTIVHSSGVTTGELLRYQIVLQNKSDNIIYVDLANSFRIMTNGESKNFFNNEQVTVSDGYSRGGGISLGTGIGGLGIGIEGSLSSSHMVSSTHENERVIPIAAHSKVFIGEYRQVHVKGDEYMTVSDLEEYRFNIKEENIEGGLKSNEYITLSEAESPYSAQYYVTYSMSPDFSSYFQLYSKLYAKYLVGGKIDDRYISSKEKLIKNIQSRIKNFWTDKGVIVGGCIMLL